MIQYILLAVVLLVAAFVIFTIVKKAIKAAIILGIAFVLFMSVFVWNGTQLIENIHGDEWMPDGVASVVEDKMNEFASQRENLDTSVFFDTTEAANTVRNYIAKHGTTEWNNEQYLLNLTKHLKEKLTTLPDADSLAEILDNVIPGSVKNDTKAAAEQIMANWERLTTGTQTETSAE